jgi:pyruvate,orthophosphate dikinase
MPGMMDTVLNLGMNDSSVEGLIAKTGNARFAWDSYRRFVQMFGVWFWVLELN